MGQLKEKPTVKSVTVSFVNVFHQDDFTKLKDNVHKTGMFTVHFDKV